MIQTRSRVLEHVPLAEKTYRIRLSAPTIAAKILPGQFLMLKLPGLNDPLLGRPFAVYDVDFKQQAIDVVYLVIGKMTTLLQEISPGQELEIWGPLGNGFPELSPGQEAIFVAGGIGQTPFLAYAHQLLGTKGFGGRAAKRVIDKVTLYYGVRNKNLLAGVSDFEKAGVQVKVASDDGSVGYHGLVTGLLEQDPPKTPIITCGPEPMLKAVSKLAEKYGVHCYVSLETPMACGFGACFSCVTAVKIPEGVDYKRVCIDGPVFEASKLVWGH
jgi:dihydroorotate dehydrogenase electron transfer subunit